MQKGFVLAANAALGIQRLIAAAVPNLESVNVVILDEKGRIVGSPSPSQVDLGLPQPLEQEKQAIEQYYEARARLVIERAYPVGGLNVAVSADVQSQLAAQSEATGGAPDWNPATRSFPLRIAITPSGMLDLAARDNIRNLVAGVVGFDAAKNDIIEFGAPTDSAVAPTPPPRSIPPRVTSDNLQPMAIDNVQYAATVAVFFLLAGIAGIFLWRLRRPKRLSDVQRAQLAAKFRSLLEQGDHHVTS
jgi:flagellar biosynthesis/type III secretory pathway M-ring protein FliF/YscJ